MKVSVTTVGSAWTMQGEHRGPGPWLGLIHECNRLTDGKMFGSPEISHDRDGNYVEIYDDADVTHMGEDKQDSLIRITSKTAPGAVIIMQAAENMGLRFTRTEN